MADGDEVELTRAVIEVVMTTVVDAVAVLIAMVV